MNVPVQRYAAFISYRHKPRDRLWAIRVMTALETYRTPKPLQALAFPARVGHLFRDEDEIPSSSDLSDQIKDALSRSDNLIVVCSPDTPGSRWVGREIELFQEMGKGDRILPLLIAGEPDEAFPPGLKRRRVDRHRPDGTCETVWEEFEPVAADIRPRNDESRIKTERRAVLRLASALLGCRFDDLARRDDERRRAKLRQKLGATAAAMGVAGIGGFWWWDANLRVKTQVCAAYGGRWAVPYCIGELSQARQSARATSFRLHIQGGRVLDMARVNGSGFPADRQNTEAEEGPWLESVALWHFEYRTDALASEPRLASVDLKDKTGKPLRQISYEYMDRRNVIAHFNRGFGTAERQSAAGSALGAKVSEGKYDVPTHSSIGQHRLTFDDRGLFVRREFEPVGGGTGVSDVTGSYGTTYVYSATGLPTEIRNLDALGKPLVEKSGIASKRLSYGDRGDVRSVEWLDADGKLRATDLWYAKIVLDRDANGNVERESYLDETGKPALRRDRGIASLTDAYDIHGNALEEAYFDTSGNATPRSDDRVARIKLQYDARGNEVLRSYYNLDGKPTLQKAGVARVARNWDEQGHQLKEMYYGVDGSPTLSIEAIASLQWRYDERGNQVEQAYFGVDGKPTLVAVDGIAGVVWRYDDRGNQIELAYFGVDRKPIIAKQRLTAREASKYDDRGNQVKLSYFGVDGQPTLSWEGVAGYTLLYDEQGNKIDIRFFGVDGNPAMHRDGYARWTQSFDKRGNLVERADFDLDGRPTISKGDGTVRAKYRYDERGNRVEVAFFGVDGNPMLSSQNIARWVSTYDERGIEIETKYFGVDGLPTLHISGAAQVRKSYDKRGNIISNTFFGVDGKPMLDRSGMASSTFRYDERGLRIGEAYFGLDSKPTLSDEGIARVTYRYDERGNKIEEACFGVSDELTISALGFARWVSLYDVRGNGVEIRYFDDDNKAMKIIGDSIKIRYSYDQSNQRISDVYLDEHDVAIPVEVEITGVYANSTAAKIGLQLGDRLLSYNGEKLGSVDQLIALTGNARPGTKELGYRRGETTFAVQVPPGRLGADVANVRATSADRR